MGKEPKRQGPLKMTSAAATLRYENGSFTSETLTEY